MGFPIGPLLTQLAQARSSYVGGQKAEEDSQLQKALMAAQIARQQKQDALSQALNQSTLNVNQARVHNYDSLSSDRSFKEDADPIVAHQIAQDGTPYNVRKSGAWEKATVLDGGKAPSAPAPTGSPTSAPIPSAPALSGGGSLVDALRGNMGLRAMQSPPQSPTQSQQAPQAPSAPPLSAGAPKFGRPIKQAPDPIAVHAANRAFDAAHPVPGAPDRVLLQTLGPDGKPVYTRRPDAVGQTPVPGGGGGMGGGGMGSGGIGGVMRQSAAVTGMAQAEPLMTAFENDPHRQLDGFDYWQKMQAGMYDAKGIKDEALHAAVYSHLNQSNPQLANYLRAAETWALEDSQLSGRPSDFRTKLDAFISQIGPNADDTQKQNTQMFRKTRLAELQRFQPAMQAIGDRIAGGGRGGSPLSPGDRPGPPDMNRGAKPISAEDAAHAKADPKFAAWLKANGYGVP